MKGASNAATDVVTYAFLVAAILVLTRPGSNGSGFVTSLANGLTGLVQGASGQKVTT
jgi:hypothetical protein